MVFKNTINITMLLLSLLMIKLVVLAPARDPLSRTTGISKWHALLIYGVMFAMAITSTISSFVNSSNADNKYFSMLHQEHSLSSADSISEGSEQDQSQNSNELIYNDDEEYITANELYDAADNLDSPMSLNKQ